MERSDSSSNFEKPSSRRVRKRMLSLIRTTQDLMHFLLDYFPREDRRFDSGTDRKTIENYLLSQYDPEELWQKLDIYEKDGGAELADEEADETGLLRAGLILSDRYRLIEEIGSGKFSVAWRALDVQIDKNVVIKFLLSKACNFHQVMKFYRGSERMHSMNHPSIVRILELPKKSNGLQYFVIEYKEGGNLCDAVLSKKITQHGAVRALLQISSAIEYIHKCGIIHLGIKPQNILLDRDGNAFLADFDFSLTSSQAQDPQKKKSSHQIFTPPKTATRADERTDLWGLGMCLAFAVYGDVLPEYAPWNWREFTGQLFCSNELRVILEKSTASDPNERYFSPKDFQIALKEIQEREVDNQNITMPSPAQSDSRTGLPPAKLKKIIHNVGLIGITASGKTSIIGKLIDRDFDVNSTHGTKIQQFEPIPVTHSLAEAALDSEHMVRFIEWGGEYLVEAQNDMIVLCRREARQEDSEFVLVSGIEGLVFVVDLGQWSFQERRHVFDKEHIDRQINSYFSRFALQFILHYNALAVCRKIILFINKIDLISDDIDEGRARAKEYFRELIANMAAPREQRKFEVEVVAGAASTGESISQLHQMLLDSILGRKN